MNAFTITAKGGGPMVSQQSQPRDEGDEEKFVRSPVDWSVDTIVVNGLPLTILFPDEDKPLPTI